VPTNGQNGRSNETAGKSIRILNIQIFILQVRIMDMEDSPMAPPPDLKAHMDQ
jgi:hypothetical protein